MNGRDNLLFIVEGCRLEPAVISQMTQVYQIHCNTVSVCANIHMLYNSLKKEGGFYDLIPVLKEQLTERLKHQLKEQEKRYIRADLEALNQNYSSIYLVFDSEFQHTPGKTTDCLKNILSKNYQDLKDMLQFFDNETEQGKLYINYPMMESYRDCDEFFDEEYRDRFVNLENLFRKDRSPSYKALVAARSRLASYRIESLSSSHFNLIILMNVFKLHFISDHQWAKPSYQKFRQISDQTLILEHQKQYCDSQDQLAVLNTLMFFMIDYKGLDFYNSLSLS